jgi:hypothetical protein
MVSERMVIALDHDGQADGNAVLKTSNTLPVDLRRLIRRLKRAASGGPFTVWMASDAAEVIGEMLDIVTGRAVVVPATSQEWKWPCRPSNPDARGIDDLSDAEIERLRLINAKLVEAEIFIRQRTQRALDDYFKAGGLRGRWHDEAVREDVEIEVKVDCVLHRDHPDFDEEDDNIVASLDWMDGFFYDRPDVIKNWNVFGFCEGHRLQRDSHCWLFHDLYDHRLVHDWDRILSIGDIWVDVSLIAQRGIYIDGGQHESISG